MGATDTFESVTTIGSTTRATIKGGAAGVLRAKAEGFPLRWPTGRIQGRLERLGSGQASWASVVGCR